MKQLDYDECAIIAGGVDYFSWSQYGMAGGAVLGALHAFKGPMTGAALAFTPFKMVLHGIAGAGIGIGVGLAAAAVYQIGLNTYETSKQASGFSWSSLATILAIL